MLRPLQARLVLALLVTPFLLLVGATAFALAAVRGGEHAGIAAATIAMAGSSSPSTGGWSPSLARSAIKTTARTPLDRARLMTMPASTSGQIKR